MMLERRANSWFREGMGLSLLLVLGCEPTHELTQVKQDSSHARTADTTPTQPIAQAEMPASAAAMDAGAMEPPRSPSADASVDARGAGGVSGQAAAPDAGTAADAGAAPGASAERDAGAPTPSEPTPSEPTPSEPTADWPADCEEHYVFKAHGASMPGDTSRFSVESGAEHLTMFYFATPWSGDVQILEVRAHLDNANLVHHWALYSVDNPEARDGEVRSGGAAFYVPVHRGSRILHAAARGAPGLRMPEGVGLQVPSGAGVALATELHYLNAGDVTATDASAVEICVTSKKRQHEAASHVVGRMTFTLPARERTDVSGTCLPMGSQSDIHLVSVLPHMHMLGVRSTWTLNRANGERVSLLDVPFSFQEQRSYALPVDRSSADVVMRPGDSLTTTCIYENNSDAVVTSGDRTEDEMCQPMVLAWPAGALENGVLSTGLPGIAPLDCVEL